jgi:hypothetical protein
VKAYRVVRSTEQTNYKDSASRQTAKITKENREKHKWKHAECDHVKKGEKKGGESS